MTHLAEFKLDILTPMRTIIYVLFSVAAISLFLIFSITYRGWPRVSFEGMLAYPAFLFLCGGISALAGLIFSIFHAARLRRREDSLPLLVLLGATCVSYAAVLLRTLRNGN